MSFPLNPPPPPGLARLITRPDDLPSLSPDRETDARTALTRGLADYIAQLSVEVLGGRRVQFRNVLTSWAEPEEGAQYPSAAVTPIGLGTYDASKFTPTVKLSDRIPLPDGRYLVSPCELVQDIQIDAWCNDPEERQAVAAMLEDALTAPTDFMYGVRMELPFYFNQRAEYALNGGEYLDTEEQAMRRYRRFRMVLTGTVPVIKVVSFPGAPTIVKLVLEVNESVEPC